MSARVMLPRATHDRNAVNAERQWRLFDHQLIIAHPPRPERGERRKAMETEAGLFDTVRRTSTGTR